jgi:hypothetical protein
MGFVRLTLSNLTLNILVGLISHRVDPITTMIETPRHRVDKFREV